MASDDRIEIAGLGKLAKALKQIDEDLPAELKSINREAAEDVARLARTLVPVRSGRLLASIRAGSTIKSGTVKTGKAKVPYAPPIHWGWAKRGIRPNPFLLDALDRRRDEVEATYVKQLSALTDKAFGTVQP